MDDLLSIAVSNAVAATVLALAASIVGAVYRRPALMHGLWLLVLLKLVTPPLLFLPISWPNTAELQTAEVADNRKASAIVLPPPVDERVLLDGFVPADNEKPAIVEEGEAIALPGTGTESRSLIASTAIPEPPLWPRLLSIVWGVGALVWFVVAVERLHRFRCLLRFARPAPVTLQQRTRRLAGSLGLRHCPRVRLMPGRIAPMLWACGGPPSLLVPAELLAGLSDEQLDTLLVHELAHLCRRDHWVRVLEFAVLGLYWWHPVVWYARRELREAEEQCCDAWVVSTLPGAGRAYASALLDTLDFLSPTPAAVPPLASGLSHIVDLKRRLTMIMRGNTPRSLTWPGCLAVLTLGMTFLPMLPSLHGQAPEREDQNRSVAETRKSLDAAKAELERAKANLEKEMARLEQMEAQHRKAVALKEAQLKIEAGRARRQATVALAVGEQRQDGKPAMRIEIVVEGEGGVNVAELSDKLKKAIGQKNAQIRITVDPDVRVRPKEAPQDSGRQVRIWRVEDGKVIETRPGTAASAGVKGSAAGDQDKRINDLEKKLEKVLQELHDLRNQMRPPRGGGASSSSDALPAANPFGARRPKAPVPARPLSAAKPVPPQPPADPTSSTPPAADAPDTVPQPPDAPNPPAAPPPAPGR